MALDFDTPTFRNLKKTTCKANAKDVQTEAEVVKHRPQSKPEHRRHQPVQLSMS